MASQTHLNATSRPAPYGVLQRDGTYRWQRSRRPLDLANEALAEIDRRLHPTKGFRRLTVRRSRAGAIVNMLKSGQRSIQFRFQNLMLGHTVVQKLLLLVGF